MRPGRGASCFCPPPCPPCRPSAEPDTARHPTGASRPAGCSKGSRCKAAWQAQSEAYVGYVAAIALPRQRRRWALFSSLPPAALPGGGPAGQRAPEAAQVNGTRPPGSPAPGHMDRRAGQASFPTPPLSPSMSNHEIEHASPTFKISVSPDRLPFDKPNRAVKGTHCAIFSPGQDLIAYRSNAGSNPGPMVGDIAQTFSLTRYYVWHIKSGLPGGASCFATAKDRPWPTAGIRTS